MSGRRALPLALMGVPVVVLVILKALMNIYMFLQHTRTVGKLGFIERFMVTSIRKMGEPARSCDRADTGERDWKAPRRGAGRGLGALRPRGVRPVSAAPVRRRP